MCLYAICYIYSFQVNAVDLCNCWSNFSFLVRDRHRGLLTNENCRRNHSSTKNRHELIVRWVRYGVLCTRSYHSRLYGIIGMTKAKTNVKSIILKLTKTNKLIVDCRPILAREISRILMSICIQCMHRRYQKFVIWIRWHQLAVGGKHTVDAHYAHKFLNIESISIRIKSVLHNSSRSIPIPVYTNCDNDLWNMSSLSFYVVI